MRECPNCHKQFKSNESYRVHKHRFHRELKQAQEQIAEQPTANKPLLSLDMLESGTESRTEEKKDSDSGWFDEEVPASQSEKSKGGREATRKGDPEDSGSWDWLVWIGAAAIAALAFLGWRKQ